MNRIKRAIIMAAGKGERLQPLTLKTPKPLLIVNEKPIIEGIIETLLDNDINEIYIVVGYLKEQFYYLEKKYNSIKIIDNPFFDKYNNLASLYVARDHIDNAVIIDGDQIINNKSILNPIFIKSSYCVTKCQHQTKEWLLDVEENKVITCHRNGGNSGYQLYSVSKWTKEDGNKLKKLVEKEFVNNNTQSYWDDIALNLYPKEFDLGIEIVNDNDIVEIDTYDEYINYKSLL